MQAEVTLGMFTEFGDAVELLVDRGQQRVDYPHCLKSFGYDAFYHSKCLGTKTTFLCLILIS